MTGLALLRCHSRPMVALGLDLSSLRMELAHISHHQEAKHSFSFVSKTRHKHQPPLSRSVPCSRAQVGMLAAFQESPCHVRAPSQH